MPSSWQNEPRSIALGLRKLKEQQKPGPHWAFLQKETVMAMAQIDRLHSHRRTNSASHLPLPGLGKERSERVDKISIRAPIRPRAAATPTTVAAQVVADHGSPVEPVAVVIKAF